ncbi:hypothetical protein KPATCC21470_8636 [Kitasatospora purpeofusca]
MDGGAASRCGPVAVRDDAAGGEGGAPRCVGAPPVEEGHAALALRVGVQPRVQPPAQPRLGVGCHRVLQRRASGGRGRRRVARPPGPAGRDCAGGPRAVPAPCRSHRVHGRRDICLHYNYLGDLSSEELGFFGRSQRADDILLTRSVLVGTFWAQRITDRTETHLPRRSGWTEGTGRRRAAQLRSSSARKAAANSVRSRAGLSAATRPAVIRACNRAKAPSTAPAWNGAARDGIENAPTARRCEVRAGGDRPIRPGISGFTGQRQRSGPGTPYSPVALPFTATDPEPQPPLAPGHHIASLRRTATAPLASRCNVLRRRAGRCRGRSDGTRAGRWSGCRPER